MWAREEVTRDKRGIADLSASTHSPTADSRDVFMLTGALRMRQTFSGVLLQGGTALLHHGAPPGGLEEWGGWD